MSYKSATNLPYLLSLTIRRMSTSTSLNVLNRSFWFKMLSHVSGGASLRLEIMKSLADISKNGVQNHMYFWMNLALPTFPLTWYATSNLL